MSNFDSVVSYLVARAEEIFGDSFSRSEVNEMLSRELPKWLKPRILSLCAKSHNSRQPMQKLNYDTFSHICSFLSLSESFKLRAASKWTKGMVDSFFKRNTELTIDGIEEAKHLMQSAVAFPNVISLKLVDVDISFDFIASQMKENFRELETLHIVFWDSDDYGSFLNCFRESQKPNCHNVWHLTNFFAKFKNLKKITLSTYSALAFLGGHSADIIYVSEQEVQYIFHLEVLQKLDKLITLQLFFESGSICLKNLSRTLTELYLKSDDIKDFENDSENLGRVRKLGLHVAHITDVRMVRLLSQFTSLESLSLDFSKNKVFAFSDVFIQYISTLRYLKCFTLIDRYSKLDSLGFVSILSEKDVINVLKALPFVEEIIVKLKEGKLMDETQSQNSDDFQEDLLESSTYESFCYNLVKEVEVIAKNRRDQRITLSLSSNTLSKRVVLPNLSIV